MKLRRNIILITTGLLLIGSFFLPDAVAGVTDSGRLNNITLIDSQSIIFEALPKLSMPERLELVANPNTEMVVWKSGNVMDAEAAEKRAILELTRFFSGSMYNFNFKDYSVEDNVTLFIIDPQEPTVNLIVWELTLIDSNENNANIIIDDETGYIMKIVFRQGRASRNLPGVDETQPATATDEDLYAKASNLTELMSAYYGLSISLADYHYSGSISYYKAEIHDHGRIIPMFGVVRASSFTLNERV